MNEESELMIKSLSNTALKDLGRVYKEYAQNNKNKIEYNENNNKERRGKKHDKKKKGFSENNNIMHKNKQEKIKSTH